MIVDDCTAFKKKAIFV